MRLALAAGLCLASPVRPVLAEAVPDADERQALARVVATMEAAIVAGPEVRARLAGLREESSEILSRVGPGAPSFSWQREGIGGGFEPEANAGDYFRFSTLFNLPWRISDNRDLRQGSERVVDLGSEAVRLEVAGRAGRAWIDLAAETEKVRVAQTRLARLQRTVEIERRKYELGEVSGSEKTQLELQLAREASLLTSTLASRRAFEERVLAWTASEFPKPAPGDLEILERETASPEEDSAGLDRLLEGSVLALEADSRSELARAESELVRSTAWGRPEVDVEWQRFPEIEGIEGYDAFGFRIGIPLPLGKSGRRKIAASEYRAEAAEAERERLRLVLASRLAAAEAAVAANELVLSSLEPTLAEMPRIELSLSEQFRLGAISYVVYLDGLARLDEVRLQVIEARRALVHARLELAELTGDRSLFPSPGIPERSPTESESSEDTP